jgi:hypothetical protein
MDERTFKEEMIILQKYYGHRLDDFVYNIYSQKLLHLTKAQFKKCTSNLIDSTFRPTSKVPFPLVSDFLKEAGEGIEDRAINIVSHTRKAISIHGAYESINFGDTALHATIKGYGGWVKICNWSDNDWMMKQTAFINSYKAALKMDTKSYTYLPGIHERNNVGRYEVAPPKTLLLNDYNNVKEIGCSNSSQKQLENITNKIVKKMEEI